MYELNGRPVSMDTLKEAATKYNMDFNSYLQLMKGKGLKEVDTDVQEDEQPNRIIGNFPQTRTKKVTKKEEEAPSTTIKHHELDDLKDYRFHKAEEDVSKKLNNLYKPQGYSVEIPPVPWFSDKKLGQDVIQFTNDDTGETKEFKIPSGLTTLSFLGRTRQGGEDENYQDFLFKQLDADIKGWINGQESKKNTPEAKDLRNIKSKSPRFFVAEGYDKGIYETDVDNEHKENDRVLSGGLDYFKDVSDGKDDLIGNKNRLTTKEISNLTDKIYTETRKAILDPENYGKHANTTQALFAPGQSGSWTWGELSEHNRKKVGKAVLTEINQQRAKDGKGLISYGQFNKIFGEGIENNGVLDVLQRDLRSKEVTTLKRLGIDVENVDRDFIEKRLNDFKNTKNEKEKYKIDEMQKIFTIEDEILELERKLFTVTDPEEIENIHKQIRDKEASLLVHQKNIAQNARGVFGKMDYELNSYFTKRGQQNINYSDTRKKEMKESYEHTVESLDALIAEIKARYGQDMTHRQALQKLLEEGIITEQRLIKESEEKYITLDITEKGLELAKQSLDRDYTDDYIARHENLFKFVLNNEDKLQKFPDGSYKLEMPIADMYEGSLGGNAWDNWWDFLKTPKGFDVNDDDVEFMKSFRRAKDKVEARNLAIYDLAVLNVDPKDVYKGTKATQLLNAAGKTTLTMLGVSDHEADKVISLGKEHTNRYMLDQYSELSRVYNTRYKDDIEKGDVPVLNFTEEQVENMTRTFGDNVSEGVGHMVPVLVQLAGITYATRGMGAIPAIKNVVSSLDKLRKTKGVWGTVGSAAWHTGALALEEAKMQIAGFKPGSGSAFYLGGWATSGFGPKGKYAALAPLFQKFVKTPVVGAASMEFAQIVEIGWEEITGVKDFDKEMEELFGHYDEIEQRLITNAFVFGLSGVHHWKPIRTEGKIWEVNKWRPGTDFMSADAKRRVAVKLQKENRELLRANGGKVGKDGKTIENAKEVVENLSAKDKSKYNSRNHIIKDMTNLYLTQSYHQDIDFKTKKGQKKFQQRVVDPLNEMIKSVEPGHEGIKVRFTSDRSEFSFVDKDGRLIDSGADAQYEFMGKDKKTHEILIDPTKVDRMEGSNKFTHEVTHAMLRTAFMNNNRYNNFVNKMKDLFEQYDFAVVRDENNMPVFKTASEMEAAIKKEGKYEGGKLDYRKAKDKRITNEEFLAYMAEFLTMPEMYTKYVAHSFMSEVKATTQRFIDNTFGVHREIRQPEDLMRVFAGFGRAVRLGDKQTIKTRGKQLQNLFLSKENFLGIEVKVAQQGGHEAVKLKSAKIVEQKAKTEAAKEKKIELQEKRTQAREKYFKEKEGLSAKEVAKKRDEFLEVQKDLTSKIAEQDIIISGKRDYVKEITEFNAANPGKENKQKRNKFIAKLNSEVSESMAEVRGIELLPDVKNKEGKVVKKGAWNERNSLIRRRDVTLKNQYDGGMGKLSKREYDNKVADINRKLAEINKNVDWKAWNKYASDLAIINAGKIENVTKMAYRPGANLGTSTLSKSDIKAEVQLQFLEVVADYKFATPGKAEFGAYMNTALPSKAAGIYNAEITGEFLRDQSWWKEKEQTMVEEGPTIAGTNLNIPLGKKQPKSEDITLEKENTGADIVDKLKTDVAAQELINKSLTKEGVVNSEAMYEKALKQLKKETIDDIPIKKGGKRRYTDKQAEELARITPWQEINSAVIDRMVPDVVNKMLGITPKKGNISLGSIKNGQNWMDINAESFVELMKWNSAVTPGKGIPKRMIAVSMNLPKKWLDKFYHEPTNAELIKLGFKISEKTGRVDTPAGPRPKVLNENITAEQVKEFVGIKPDGTKIVDRNLSSTIKGIPIILDKGVSNKLIRNAIRKNNVELGIQHAVEGITDRLKTDIPGAWASRLLFATQKKYKNKSLEEIHDMFLFYAYGEHKNLTKGELKFLSEFKIDKVFSSRDAAMLFAASGAKGLIGKINKVDFRKQHDKFWDNFKGELPHGITAKEMKSIDFSRFFTEKTHKDGTTDVIYDATKAEKFINTSIEFSKKLPPAIREKSLTLFDHLLGFHQRATAQGETRNRVYKEVKKEDGTIEVKEKFIAWKKGEEFGLMIDAAFTSGRERSIEAQEKDKGKSVSKYWDKLKNKDGSYDISFSLVTKQEAALRKLLEGKFKSEAERIKLGEEAFGELDARSRGDFYNALESAKQEFVQEAKNKKEYLARQEWMYQLAAMNSGLRMGVRQLVPTTAVYWGKIPKGDAIKLEHQKVMVQQANQIANLVATGRYTAEGREMTKDYVGILGLRDAHWGVMDKLGGKTNIAGLYRLALLEPGILKQYRTVESGFKETLYDKVMRDKGEVIKLLGDKKFAKLVKDHKLLELQHKKIIEGSKMPIRKNAGYTERMKSMKIFEEAREQGRKRKKEKRGISVWDFDDTIATTKSGVLAKIPNPSGTPMPKRKVIFMAGGPGAGKSSVIKGLGLEKQGFKIVNQDISLQWLAKNHGLPKDMRDFTPEQRSKWSSLQWEAREIAQKKQIKFEGRGDGIIVDGTGQSAGSMTAQRMAFQRKGYDVSMLYVETSLPTALARNKARKERSLTDKIVERTWKNVDFNKKGFKEEFGENFIEVKTDKLKLGDPLPPEVVTKADRFTKSYEKRRLTAEEFANRGKEILDRGGKFDFSEFELVREGKPGPFFDKFVKRMGKYGPKDQFILTARPPESAPHIHMWLKMEGYTIPLENIKALGNSTAEAKALWMLEKFKEGYNDFYFADDAIKNVKEVKNVLEQLDVKSNVQQARMKSGKLFSEQFNKIIEETSGIPAKAIISPVKAAMMGKDKYSKSLLLPQQQDFMGLMQNFMGKGKKGEAHLKWFEDNLSKPYSRGFNDLLNHRQSILDDFKRLKISTPEINGNLATKGNKYRNGFKDLLNRKWPSTWKEIADLKSPNRKGNYTYEDAIRVYLWNKNGIKVPGMSKTDMKNLTETVMKDSTLKDYADKLGELSRQDGGYVEPGKYWHNETIMSDVYKMTQEMGQKKFLAEWIENKNAIFTPENMNKIEATEGKWFRESLEDMLYAMEMGTNRPSGMSREAAMFMNYINGSVGATMNWNMRSAIIQQLSMINFINWKDNNPVQAAKAFANLPQFAKDYAMIFNSPMMQQRRKGLKINVSESEIASAVQSGGARGLFNYFLKLGFTPTMIGDSNAIAFGGATFYRNRLKTYLKEGMEQKAAEKQAFLDFQQRSEPTQQSSRPDLVSKWQRDPWLGRFLMAFASVNSQQVRRGEKATRNAVNKRGDQKENLSQIATYGFLQPILYGAMSAAMIAMYLDEEDSFTEKEQQDKAWRFANTALDSQLRGFGYPGAGVSALKNTALEWHKQNKKPWGGDHAYTLMQLTSVSPTLNIKLRDIYGGLKTLDYNEDLIGEMNYWDLDNPHWMSKAQMIQGATNFPTKRFMYKRQNMKGGLDQNAAWWQRAHMISGWSPWDVGYQTDVQKEREKLKETKRKKKKGSIIYLNP